MYCCFELISYHPFFYRYTEFKHYNNIGIYKKYILFKIHQHFPN